MKASIRSFSLTTLFAGFGSFSSILLVIILLDEANFSLSEVGIVLTSYSGAILIFSPLWGYLSDKIGQRKIFLIGGYLLFAAASLLYLVANELHELMMVRALQGVGYAAHPMLTALFTDHFGKQAQRRFGSLSGAEAFGWGTGSLVAGFMADQMGIAMAIAWIAILPAMSALLVLFKLPEAKMEPKAPKSEIKDPNARFPKKLFWLYGTIYIRMTAAIALWSMMPIYLKTFVESKTGIGAITAINMVIQPVFMLLLGKYSEQLGRLRLVIWGIVGTVITFWIYGIAGSIIEMLVGQLFIALSWAGIVIGMNTYVMDTAPQGSRGKAFGYLQGSITLAMATGPTMGGMLSQYFINQGFTEFDSIRSMIFVVSIVMLFSLPFVIRLRMKDKKTQQEAATS